MSPPGGQASSILQSCPHGTSAQPSAGKKDCKAHPLPKPVCFRPLRDLEAPPGITLAPVTTFFAYRTRLDGWPSRGLEGHGLRGGSLMIIYRRGRLLEAGLPVFVRVLLRHLLCVLLVLVLNAPVGSQERARTKEAALFLRSVFAMSSALLVRGNLRQGKGGKGHNTRLRTKDSERARQAERLPPP